MKCAPLTTNETTPNLFLFPAYTGDLSCKPGWVRMSIHPTMTDEEVIFIMHSIESTAANFAEWAKDYQYHPDTNEYSFKGSQINETDRVKEWFDL